MRHPQYYLGRADETRVIAEATLDPHARDFLLSCVAEYELLAKLATKPKGDALATLALANGVDRGGRPRMN